MVAGVILLLAALGAVAFWGASKTGLKRELAAIREKGLPTNPAELDKWYSEVPVEENAGLKFLEARAEYVEAGEGRDPGRITWSEIPHDQRLDATTMAMLRFHLKRNSNARDHAGASEVNAQPVSGGSLESSGCNHSAPGRDEGTSTAGALGGGLPVGTG